MDAMADFTSQTSISPLPFTSREPQCNAVQKVLLLRFDQILSGSKRKLTVTFQTLLQCNQIF
jgi:hypothetical protein